MNRVKVLALTGLLALCTGPEAAAAPASPNGPRVSWLKLPLAFEANRGQAGADVHFLARSRGLTVLLGGEEARFVFAADGHEKIAAGKPRTDRQATVVRMRLPGAARAPRVEGVGRLPGASNYFVGPDPARWLTGIPRFEKVRYSGVYPGVDLVFYGNGRRLEFDFIVAPGADPGRIRLQLEGTEALRVGARGDLLLTTRRGLLRLAKPRVYQQAGGRRRPVAGRYRLAGPNRVAFELGDYRTDRPLIIDPVLDYSTFFGGNADEAGNSIAVDADGNAYIAGFTASVDLAATSGAYQTSSGGNRDVFVVKLNPTGTALVWATYLGGGGNDRANAIAVDAAGSAYIAGYGSIGFPVTPGAFRTECCGAFVAKLNAAGDTLLYSTFLGSGEVYGLAVDSAGNAFFSGLAYSSFPTTPGAFQTVFGGGTDAFAGKLDAAGASLLYSTFLGGAGFDRAYGIAIDSSGNAYVTGSTYSSNFPTSTGAFQSALGGGVDAFLVKLDPDGGGLAYSTLLGGSSRDEAYAVAVDSAGVAYVTGLTASGNFPVTPGAWRTAPPSYGYLGFVTALNAAGTGPVYSTFLGPVTDYYTTAFGITVDGAGSAYVTGATAASDFPVTADVFQPVAGGGADAFLLKLNAAGSAVVYSTYLGGVGNDYGRSVARDAGGAVYITGITESASFPAVTGAQQGVKGAGRDAFVAKISEIPVSCSYSVSPATVSYTAAGGTGSVAVTTASGCVWTARSTASWITVSAGASGIGSGVVDYSVGANPLPGGRIGTLVVGGQSVAVSQTGIAPSTPNAPSGPSIGVTGFAYSFTASGSGDGMEYRFDWGDGRYSAWSDGAGSVAWSAAGTYAVRAQARNRYCPSLVSAWSAPLNLTIYRPEDILTNEEYVTQLCRDILNRDPSPAGLAYFTSKLETGTVTREYLATVFFNSPEFENFGGFVVRCTLGVLGREPSFAGWLYYYNRMQAGLTQEELASAFMASPEFLERYGEPNNEEFVTLAAQNTLGRDPSPGGLSYYVNLLDSGAMTRAQIMVSFILSAESTERTKDLVAVYLLHFGFLRRSPDPEEYASWLDYLKSGNLSEGAVEAFLADPEYLTRFL